MVLINSKDSEIQFNNLECAKDYYYPSDEQDIDTKNPENFSGTIDEYMSYLDAWNQYKADILASNTLNELADVLNRNSDTFQNGSIWKVI